MKPSHISFLTFALFLGLTAQSSAATITFAGFIEGSAVNNWRTAAVSKLGFDIDGNNVLGSSLGAANWEQATTGQTGIGSGSFGWSDVSALVGFNGDPRLASIDNILNPGFSTTAGATAFGVVFTFGLEGSPLNYVGQTVRVGIMKDTLLPDYFPENANTILQLVGSGGDSGVISLRGGSIGDTVAEMYFFDIAGVNPGDQFSIMTNSSGLQDNYIGPVSWDITGQGVEIPFGVDSTLGLAVLGALGALRLRRRRSA